MKRTPKQIVLLYYPTAVAKLWADEGWCVERYGIGHGYADLLRPVGTGKTANQAWVDAAKNLQA